MEPYGEPGSSWHPGGPPGPWEISQERLVPLAQHPAVPPAPPRATRRWGLFGVCIFLIATSAALAGWAWHATDRANQWFERAGSLEKDAGELASERDEALAALGRSEDDVAGLEADIRTQSELSASSGTDLVVAEAERQALLELIDSAINVNTGLDVCAQYEQRWGEIQAGKAAGAVYDEAELQRFDQSRTGTCSDARQAAQAVQQSAESFRR
jgi:hypothetical protein